MAGLVVYAPQLSNVDANRLKLVYSKDKNDVLDQSQRMPHMLVTVSWKQGGLGMVYGKVEKGEDIVDAINREFRCS